MNIANEVPTVLLRSSSESNIMINSFPRRLLTMSVIVLALISNESKADLTVNLTFGNFSTGAPADGSAILGGRTLAEAQTVIETAATYWEKVFENSSSSIAWSSNVGGNLTQTIDITWGAQTGSTLAQGGTSFFSDGRWAAGASVVWDNDGSSEFYIDTAPTNNTEWIQFSERDITFNSVNVNSERVYYDAPAGVARDNSDMLSTAIHEIGHALGFLGSGYPSFGDADLGSDGDIDITSGPLNGAQIDYAGGHTDFEILTPGSGDFPYDPGAGSFPSVNYNPSNMAPGSFNGVRNLLTEADIAIVAQYLEFDMDMVNFNPSFTAVPEPSSMVILSFAGLLVLRRKRNRA